MRIIELVDFARYLREQGYACSIREMLSIIKTMSSDITPNTEHHCHIIQTIVCRDSLEWVNFPLIYEKYFNGLSNDPNNSDSIANNIFSPRRSLVGLAGTSKDLQMLLGDEMTGAGAGRQQKNISKADFRFLQDKIALRKIEILVERLALSLRKRVKRRYHSVNQIGKINMRASFRKNISFGGVPIKLVYLRQWKILPELIILHDVSHSMVWNNPMLFRFVRGVAKYFSTSHIFAFHTELFCVTDLYKQRSNAVIKEQLEAGNRLQFGGTSIAGSLAEFNSKHSANVLSAKSIVIIISDGFDTDEPAQLVQELIELKKRAKKIIWLNPMIGRAGYQPDNAVMKSAITHLDLLSSANNLAALKKTIGFIVRAVH